MGWRITRGCAYGFPQGRMVHPGSTTTCDDVNRAARLGAADHGGQILLSQTTHDLVEHDLPAGTALHSLGAHRRKDLQREERILAPGSVWRWPIR